MPMAFFTLFQKRLLGSLYGEAKLLLDEAVKLSDVNEAYDDDMLAGRNIRGVIIHDH
jgi:S-(hydroxymethyl)glutathione dehydrogenase/alcohol dehydrogenase